MNDKLHVVNDEMISALKKAAAAAPTFRSRICLHADWNSHIQEMLIAFHARSFIGPHRQRGREKSYIVMDGEALVLFFDEEGAPVERIALRDIRRPGNSVIRFTSSRWHILVPQTEYVVYIEILQGPFSSELTEYAPWAPRHWDAEVIRNFLRRHQITLPIERQP